MSQKELLSGGTGFIGRAIVNKLIARGDEVFVLTRSPEKCNEIFNSKITPIEWKSYNDTFDTKKIKGLNTVINLVGESLTNKRWSDNQKKEIYNSRVVATDNLFKSLRAGNIKVDQFISTSAIGIYGDGFLKNVCEKWEEASFKGKDAYERLVIMRLSVVLGASDGMIQELAPIFKLGLGGKLGSGSQMMSWIHIDDLSDMYIEAIDNEDINGPLNAVSRFNVSNKDFTKTFSKLLGKKAKFTVPKFMLFIAKGEVASMILESMDVVPTRFNELKFKYNFATMELALKDIVSKL